MVARRLSAFGAVAGAALSGQAPYDLEAGLLEGYAQLAAGNFRKGGMSEIIERAERETREEGDA